MNKQIPLFKVNICEEVDKSLLEVLHSGYIGQGQKVEEFEQKLAEFLEITKNKVLTMNSGTSALHLALHLAEVKGRSVISTPLTCTATNFPIILNGAKIFWADINPNTANISVDSVERLLRKYCKDIWAIMVVHWGGYPCDLDELNKLAASYDIPVIEDAAHAFGAIYKGIKIGSISKYTCFSFQAIKHLTTIDGGLLTISDDVDYKRGKLLRWYGIDREDTNNRSDLRCENDVKEIGYKFHMNDVTATIGLVNLQNIKNILAKHRDNAVWYKNNFINVSGITLLEEKDDRQSSYWLFTMKVKNRDDFMRCMKEKGIMVSKVHARNDKHSCLSNLIRELPNLDMFEKEMVCIPVGSHVSIEDREYITDCIKGGW